MAGSLRYRFCKPPAANPTERLPLLATRHPQRSQSVAPRIVQRGARYAVTITDYVKQRRVVVTHCLINGLGHAWSGGADGLAYSDPKGPNASRMIWAFAARQFATVLKGEFA